jgi:pyridoxal phosphate enzyme (YggS family)
MNSEEKLISGNLKLIKERIARAAQKSGRKPEEIKLIAVSKGVEKDRITEAVISGHMLFGENYVQELKTKIEELKSDSSLAPYLKSLEFHFIGALQTNKVKYLPELVTMIQSVDRISIAGEIEKRFGNEGKDIDVLAEVNTGGEESKAGCAINDLPALVQGIMNLPHLKLRGLMTMPPQFENPEDSRKYFIRLRELNERLKLDFPELKNKMTELSMGMSNDFEVAVQEGATMVRVGTGIFGNRNC